jgi:hypothetical protein
MSAFKCDTQLALLKGCAIRAVHWFVGGSGMRHLSAWLLGGLTTFALAGAARADVVTKRGLVVPQRFEAALLAVPPPEWKNPRTGKPYTSWKEALDEADDLEDDDDDDDDGNEVDTHRKPVNPKALLEALRDADEAAERKRTPIRGLAARGWLFPSTLRKATIQDADDDNIQKTHKIVDRGDDDDDSPDDDDDVELKRFIKPLDDEKGAFFVVPLLDQPRSFDAWWKPTSARKAAEPETDEQRTKRLERAKKKLKCTRETKECVPKRSGNWTKFHSDRGDDDTVEIWTTAVFGMKHPTADQIRCVGSWNTGITVLKKKFDLVKLSGDIGSNSDKGTIDGQASVHLLGQSVWSKNGKVKDEFKRTFKTPKAEIYVPIIPFITATGSAWASATFTLAPKLEADEVKLKRGVDQRESVQRTRCGLKLTPKMETSLTGEARVEVGIPKLVSLARGGVRVSLSPINAALPVNLGVATQKLDGIPSGNLFFRANANVRVMSGKVEAFYRLGDICTPRVRVCAPDWLGGGCKTLVGKKCLVKDVLGIPTKGSKMLWKHKGYVFDKKLVDRKSTKLAWVTKEEQQAVKKP